VPPFAGLLLYGSSLTAWFQKDDFAWLQLRDLLAQGKSIWWILFEPLAQGTVRTLSERLFFLSFYEFFGLHAFPYHLAGLLTFLIAVTLLQSVAEKLTGSRAAGFWSAMLWVVNAAVATPVAWISGMNEVMFAAFFLLDLWLLLRWLETGENRYFAAQCATFLLGFGVIELNAVYPAVALLVVWIRKRNQIWKVASLIPISAIFAMVHLLVAPVQGAGPYRMYFDPRIASTLITYINWALGTGWLRLVGLNSFALRIVLAVPIALGLLFFLLINRRDRTILLFPAIFLIVLAPLLPLRDHMEYEYLTVPVIGLAMWGGWAVAAGVRRIAIPLALVYFAVSIPIGHVLVTQYNTRSARLKNVFEAVQALHPTRMLIVKGAGQETFDDMLYHRALNLIGIREVYLDSTDPFHAGFSIDAESEKRAIDEGRAAILDISQMRR